MTNEDFYQTILDFIGFATQRDLKIMATMADYDTKIANITGQLAGMVTKQTDLAASLKTAVDDLGVAVATGQSGMLDKMVATLTMFEGQLTNMAAASDAMQAELKTALATVPVPTAPAA